MARSRECSDLKLSAVLFLILNYQDIGWISCFRDAYLNIKIRDKMFFYRCKTVILPNFCSFLSLDEWEHFILRSNSRNFDMLYSFGIHWISCFFFILWRLSHDTNIKLYLQRDVQEKVIKKRILKFLSYNISLVIPW